MVSLSTVSRLTLMRSFDLTSNSKIASFNFTDSLCILHYYRNKHVLYNCSYSMVKLKILENVMVIYLITNNHNGKSLLDLINWFQVSASSRCSIKFMGSNWTIHPSDKFHQNGESKRPSACNTISILTCRPCITFYCKIWESWVDVVSRFVLGIMLWLSNCMCHDSSSQRLQGALD